MAFRVHALAASVAAFILAGCVNSQSMPGTAGSQQVRGAQRPTISWIPANVTLHRGETKVATLEFLAHHGGPAYQINCVGHFKIGQAIKQVKGGMVDLGYPLTAGPGPYHCTWQATLHLKGNETATSTLFIIIKG